MKLKIPEPKKMEKYSFSVEAEDSGIRLDKWLTLQEDLSITRSLAVKLIEDGSVKANNCTCSKSRILSEGDSVSVELPEPVLLDVLPQNIPISVVYEDDDLAVVDKPQGMVVHPAAGNPDGTLVNALLYRFENKLSGINGVLRPGIVHRIDKNTSGLLVIAKNDFAHLGLSELVKAHDFTREYEAICVGHFKEPCGTVNAPIGRDKAERKRMCVTQTNSKEAITHYQTLEVLCGYSYMKFILETGRTHQIRVHCAYLGHPILGDDVYGKPYKGCKGQCLHAKKLGFKHPRTGEYLEFESPLPEYFTKLLNDLR